MEEQRRQDVAGQRRLGEHGRSPHRRPHGSVAGGQQLLPSARENTSARASCGFWFPSRSPAGESPARPLSLSPSGALCFSRATLLSQFSPPFPILLMCFPAAQNRGLPVRRVVCCGVPRGAPWRLSDDKATP